ncbi:MAG TPA: hypothetical protein VJ508_13275, partial [Saprospiraceae bacterium]|nr:hypothetical protein [Saprospiraceae bacterium]
MGSRLPIIPIIFPKQAHLQTSCRYTRNCIDKLNGTTTFQSPDNNIAYWQVSNEAKYIYYLTPALLLLPLASPSPF